MRGLLHYYFDGVMPFLQVSLGSCTLCSLSPAASLLVFTCAVQGGVGSRRWAPAQFALRPLLPAVLVFTCAIQGGVGNRHWAWWERGGSPCSCHFVLDHLINSLGQGLLSLLSNI